MDEIVESYYKKFEKTNIGSLKEGQICFIDWGTVPDDLAEGCSMLIVMHQRKNVTRAIVMSTYDGRMEETSFNTQQVVAALPCSPDPED